MSRRGRAIREREEPRVTAHSCEREECKNGTWRWDAERSRHVVANPYLWCGPDECGNACERCDETCADRGKHAHTRRDASRRWPTFDPELVE